MLPDQLFAPSPGTTLRMYSVQHLLWQNVEGRLSPQQLAQALLETYRSADARWPLRNYVRALAIRLARGFGLPDIEAGSNGTKFDSLSDRALIELAVGYGWGLGTGAPWGVSREADLLWAAAAALTKFHGCEHPNELIAASDEGKDGNDGSREKRPLPSLPRFR